MLLEQNIIGVTGGTPKLGGISPRMTFGNILVLWYPIGQSCIALKGTMRTDITDNGNNVELEQSRAHLIASFDQVQTIKRRVVGVSGTCLKATVAKGMGWQCSRGGYWPKELQNNGIHCFKSINQDITNKSSLDTGDSRLKEVNSHNDEQLGPEDCEGVPVFVQDKQ
jgi:hypothetical protein